MSFLTHAVSIPALISSVRNSPIDASTADVVALNTVYRTQIPEPNDTDSSCTFRPNLDMFPFMRNHYQVTIRNLPEGQRIDRMCDALWASLKEWAVCSVSSPHGCDKLPGTGRDLRWHFNVIEWCNPGMVESAYWGATGRGKMGHIYPCLHV